MREPDLKILQRILDTAGGFSHREHLEQVWNFLRIYDIDTATRAVASAIRHVAAMHGGPAKYHETITRSWVHLVALHMAASKAETFARFISENPGLLDRQILDRHYSRELISSNQARIGWVQPDLRALPRVA